MCHEIPSSAAIAANVLPATSPPSTAARAARPRTRRGESARSTIRRFRLTSAAPIYAGRAISRLRLATVLLVAEKSC